METSLVKRNAVASCLSCSICLGLLHEATTVSVCLHTFCKSCITKKIVEEDISNCPQCNTYLGGDPLEKLRGIIFVIRQTHYWSFTSEKQSMMDNSLQKIRATLLPLNSYKPEVRDKSKLTCRSALSAKAAPKLNAKKGKLSSGSTHFFESGTVKNQLISHIQQVKEIEPRDHQNHSDVLVTGQGDDYRSCSSGPSPIWFSLISSTEENGSPPLPQIPLRYLNTKNGNAPVQLVKKYLVRKLNLSSEAEVEITLIGEVMGDHCCLKDLLQLWLRTRPQGKRIGQDYAKDAVMPLVYARKA